jgi:glycosyltransferase involved in cell wall biosynthesis
MKEQKIAIIIPIYNSETTIVETLESLLRQGNNFQELVLINDASSDSSISLVKDFLEKNKQSISEKKIEVKIINHPKSQGLAASYNDGIDNSKGELVVTLHSDIILREDSLQKLVAPFSEDEQGKIVATFHAVDHPFEIWNKYNFWQKCFFARLVGKKFSGLDGKFDCFRRTALLKVGKFDAERFKNAGEDGDIIFKLGKLGEMQKTEAEIVHIHSMSPNFSFRDIIQKQKQYSQSQGILLRLGRIHNWSDLPKIFFRELLVLSLLIPYLNLISLVVILFYSIIYTKIMFVREYENKRILVLPLLNVYLLFVSLIFSVKGFLYGKQKI